MLTYFSNLTLLPRLNSKIMTTKLDVNSRILNTQIFDISKQTISRFSASSLGAGHFKLGNFLFSILCILDQEQDIYMRVYIRMYVCVCKYVFICMYICIFFSCLLLLISFFTSVLFKFQFIYSLSYVQTLQGQPESPQLQQKLMMAAAVA